MYELMQHLVAFKYACKLRHWGTDNYGQHLLFDRLSQDLDTWVDSIAECYFMAGDEQKQLGPNLLNPKLINKDLVKMCESIIVHLEKIQDDDLNEGIASMLSAIEEGFLNKLALAKLS